MDISAWGGAQRFDKYERKEQIGQGAHSHVFRVVEKRTGASYALKLYDIRELEAGPAGPKLHDMLKTEFEILRKFQHPNLLDCIDIIQDEHSVGIVLEYIAGGTVQDELIRTGVQFDEKTVARFAAQLVSVMCMLSEKQVIHRDLKLENILFDGNRVVLIDFGFSKLGVENTTTHIGTAVTMAPEVYLGNYNNKCDVWSLGVCLYILAFGHDPWRMTNYLVKTDDPKRRLPFDRWLVNRKEFCGEKLYFPQEPPVSEELKQMLRGMIEVDVGKRSDFRTLSSHAFLDQSNETYSDAEKRSQILSCFKWVSKLVTETALLKYGKTDHQCLQLIVFLLSKKFLLLLKMEHKLTTEDASLSKQQAMFESIMANHKPEISLSLLKNLPKSDEFEAEIAEHLDSLHQYHPMEKKMKRMTQLIQLLFLLVIDKHLRTPPPENKLIIEKNTLLKCCKANDQTHQGFIRPLKPAILANPYDTSLILTLLYKEYKKITN